LGGNRSGGRLPARERLGQGIGMRHIMHRGTFLAAWVVHIGRYLFDFGCTLLIEATGNFVEAPDGVDVRSLGRYGNLRFRGMTPATAVSSQAVAPSRVVNVRVSAALSGDPRVRAKNLPALS
jgi:hypothetical protein